MVVVLYAMFGFGFCALGVLVQKCCLKCFDANFDEKESRFDEYEIDS